MNLEIINTIFSGIITLMGGTASVIWFYSAKKRTANAEATKAEADAISKYADEWRDLYKQRDAHVAELNNKIELLTNDLNVLRAELWEIKDKYSTAKAEQHTAEFYKCMKLGCTDRVPPNEKL